MSCINISIPKITGIFSPFVSDLFVCLFISTQHAVSFNQNGLVRSFFTAADRGIRFSSVCLSSVFHITLLPLFLRLLFLFLFLCNTKRISFLPKLDPELEDYIRNGGNSRNAIREKKRAWNTRIIPYQIPSYMSMYFCSTSPKEVTETLNIQTAKRPVFLRIQVRGRSQTKGLERG